jgi:5-methylcytosine-specific restriction endonuclease McrA
MAKRHKRRAKERRIELLMILGYSCAKCGSEDDLEFDCIVPQGDQHHRYDTSQRMSFYHKQYKLGNLQILCTHCHRKKSVDDAQNPF